MLRCEGCGVLHHPGCWVRNDGCVTQVDHKRTPIAQAYSTSRPAGAPAPHPGEGTRVIQPPATEPAPENESREPVPFAPRPRAVPPERQVPPPPGVEAPAVSEGVASAPLTPLPGRSRPQAEAQQPVAVPHAPRRYQPPNDQQPVRKPLPKVYGQHRLLAYWYMPVAALLAVGVAFGVIWVVGQFTGDDKSSQASVVLPGTATPTLSPAQASSTAAGTNTAATTPTVGRSPTPSGPAGKFKQGDQAVVTGAGDCLNVRVAPGRQNDAIVCLPDGAEVTVTGGPENAGDLRWWKVRTPQGEGWAAEDYLVRKP